MGQREAFLQVRGGGPEGGGVAGDKGETGRIQAGVKGVESAVEVTSCSTSSDSLPTRHLLARFPLRAGDR
jgi:hypothetical protein